MHDSKLIINELEKANEELMKKFKYTNRQLDDYRNKFNELDIENMNLKNFKNDIEIFNKKFPEISLNSVLNKYEFVQNFALELQDKITMKEIEIGSLNQANKEIKNCYENEKIYNKKNRIERENELQIQNLQNAFDEKNSEIMEFEKFKKDYFELSAKIISLFSEWSKKNNIYNKKKEYQDTQINKLNNPLEILDLMYKLIEISTPESSKKYIRKIIVSANLIKRKFFPEMTQEFDPDKFYYVVFEKMKKLNNEV